MADNDGPHLAGGWLSVDVVLFTRRGGVLSLLVVERGKEPYAASLALPGGFVNAGERPPDAAVRELAEETGITLYRSRLRRLGVYDTPGRDPRGRITSIAYHAYLSDAPEPRGAGDARAARWISVAEFLAPGTLVAFDHREIVAEAVRRRFGAPPEPPHPPWPLACPST